MTLFGKSRMGFLFFGKIAQIVEHHTENVGVMGAIPILATKFCATVAYWLGTSLPRKSRWVRFPSVAPDFGRLL